MPIVTFEDVSRVYTSGDHSLRALDHVNMNLDQGKFIVILGPSGAGKSTLLNLLGGLDSPTEGRILVEGKDIASLSADRLAEYRAATVGFVFQFYNLIPTLTVKENVALVKEIAPDPLDPEEILAQVKKADEYLLKIMHKEISVDKQTETKAKMRRWALITAALIKHNKYVCY